MDNLQQEASGIFSLDGKGVASLKRAARWARWLATCFFLIAGGMVYLGLRKLLSPANDYNTGAAFLAGAVFLLFPVWWLLLFAARVLKGYRKQQMELLNKAFSPLGNFFLLLASLAMIVLIVYILFVSVAGIASLLGWGAY